MNTNIEHANETEKNLKIDVYAQCDAMAMPITIVESRELRKCNIFGTRQGRLSEKEVTRHLTTNLRLA